MENRAHHWLIALIVAALFHAAVALALVRTPSQEVARIVMIAIELEPGGDSGEDGQAGPDAGGDSGGPTGTTAEQAPDALPTDSPEVPEPEATQVPDAVAESEPEPEPELLPEPEPATEVAAPVVAPVPKLVPKPKPKPKVANKPKPKPRVASKPKTKTADESRASTGQSGLAARGNDSGSGTGKGSGRGNGKGKGSAESQSRYYSQLAAWLNRHKRYPPAARRNRQTGTVRVTFTIDRNGRVLSKRIVASSGHAALDKEVEAMLRRASPMPKIPRDLGRSTLTVTLPVVFTLR